MAEVLFTTNLSSYTNPVKIYYYRQSNPLAVVGTQDVAFPNVSGQETVITGLSAQLHRFEFWEMIAGSPTNLIGGSAIYLKPKGEKVAVELYHYTVDGAEATDPESGQDTLIDARLNGKTFHVSQRVNDWIQPSDYAAITGGGFQLLNGNNFEPGDQWTVMVISNVETEVPVFAAMPVNLVSDSDDYDTTYHNKHNISTAAGVGSTQVTTFPAFALIPDHTSKFSTHSTNARYWRLQFNSGDTVRHLGEDRNDIVLRQGDELELIFEGGICYAIYKGSAELAGEYVLANKKLLNTEFADGSEHDIADFEDLINRLPAAQTVTTLTAWNETYTSPLDLKVYYKNRGKFYVNTTEGVFRFPDLRDMMFKALKDVDGTTDTTNLSQGVGGAQAPVVGNHQHQLPIWADNPAAAFDVQAIPQRLMEDFTQAVSKTEVHMTRDLQHTNENRVKTILQIPLVRI